MPNQEKEEPEKLFLWNSHCNIADKSCSDKLQITIQAYKCSSAPSPVGFEVQSSLMKRCDWKQKKIWNALSSKPGAITPCNKTLQITLLATLLQPLPQYNTHWAFLLILLLKRKVINFYHYLPVIIHLCLGKRGSKNSTRMEEVQGFTMCHEISCRNYVLWNVWPWKVQVSPSCNYSLAFWEVYNSAAEMVPAWTQPAVLGMILNIFLPGLLPRMFGSFSVCLFFFLMSATLLCCFVS